MDFSTLNLWAILVSSFTAFVIGGLWYSPLLFANSWMKEAELNKEKLQAGNMPKIFGLAFIFIFIMTFNLALFLNDPAINTASGGFYGFLTGSGWVSLALAVNSLYERKPWKYMVINGGYWTVVFTLIGIILGSWK